MEALKALRHGVLCIVICGIFVSSLVRPQSPEDLAKGISLIQKRDFKRAARHFQKLTNKHPEWAEGWFWAGQSYQRDDQPEKSIVCYDRALALNSAYKEAKFWLDVAQQHDLVTAVCQLLHSEDFKGAAEWTLESAQGVDKLKLLQAAMQLKFSMARRELLLYPPLVKELIGLKEWDTARGVLGIWMSESPESRLSALSYDALICLRMGNSERADSIIGILLAAAQEPDGIFAINELLMAELGMMLRNPIPLKQSVPGYTSAAVEAGVEGKILLSGRIDRDGRVRELRLLSDDLGYGLTESAAGTIAQEWLFKPALFFRPEMTEGNPVAIRATIEVEFNLKRSWD